MKNHHRSIGKHVSLIILLLVLYAPSNRSLGMAQEPDSMACDQYRNRAVIVIAQASKDAADQENATGSEKKHNAVSSDRKPSETQTPSKDQQSQHKKKKTFKDFSPSEKIEVDQAVDFPVDI